MEGKICIVTGASSEIGKEIARGVAAEGAHVVMVCRNRARGEAAADDIRSSAPVDLLLADLSSLDEIRRLAGEALERYPRIDVLVNNAGVFNLMRRTTVDGFEEMFAVNHLAPFLLTNLLLERLRGGGGARIVTVASDAHHSARPPLEPRGRGGWGGYARSKLGNIMFTYALARRVEAGGVTANCLHPGFVATNLGSGRLMHFSPLRLMVPFMRGPRRGADTAIWLASSPDVEGLSGHYFSDRAPHRSSKASCDEEAQERLWQMSAELTGARA